MARLAILDLRANHTTTIIEPLRLDLANYRGPSCEVSDLMSLLNLWWQMTKKTINPSDWEPASDRRLFHHIERETFTTLAPLVRAYSDGELVDPKAAHTLQFLKPDGHLNFAHTDQSENPSKLTPVLGPEAANLIDEGLPTFVTVAKKDTRRVLGFAFAGYCSGPLRLPESTGVIDEMKALRPFAHLNQDQLFTPGVYAPALAA